MSDPIQKYFSEAFMRASERSVYKPCNRLAKFNQISGAKGWNFREHIAIKVRRAQLDNYIWENFFCRVCHGLFGIAMYDVDIPPGNLF